MAVFAKPVKRLARAAGVSLTRHPAPNTLERHLRDVIRQLRVDWVLDVGAHEGAYARLVASRKGDQGWRGYRYALGREHRPGRLNLYGKSQLNSLLAPSSYGIGLFPVRAGRRLRGLEGPRSSASCRARLRPVPGGPGVAWSRTMERSCASFT